MNQPATSLPANTNHHSDCMAASMEAFLLLEQAAKFIDDAMAIASAVPESSQFEALTKAHGSVQLAIKDLGSVQAVAR